jgi:hypothetical protein
LNQPRHNDRRRRSPSEHAAMPVANAADRSSRNLGAARPVASRPTRDVDQAAKLVSLHANGYCYCGFTKQYSERLLRDGHFVPPRREFAEQNQASLAWAKKRGRGVQEALMVLLVSGSAFTRRRALRSSAPRSMESANGPACHGGGHARPSGSLRGRGATRALLERIDMRNLFSAYRDRAKPPRLPLSGRPLLAA